MFNFLQSELSSFIPIIRKMLESDLFMRVNNVAFFDDKQTNIKSYITRCLGGFRNPVENMQVRLECDQKLIHIYSKYI